MQGQKVDKHCLGACGIGRRVIGAGVHVCVVGRAGRGGKGVTDCYQFLSWVIKKP